MNITFQSLYNNKLFPSDTMWIAKDAEIVGYSPMKNKHIVIDDGMCQSGTGKYLVHIYNPDARRFPDIWHHFKYLENSRKIFEGWIQF